MKEAAEKIQQRLKITAVIAYCILWSVICITEIARYEMREAIAHRN